MNNVIKKVKYGLPFILIADIVVFICGLITSGISLYIAIMSYMGHTPYLRDLALIISTANIFAFVVLVFKIVGAALIRKANTHFESILFLVIIEVFINIVVVIINKLGPDYYAYASSVISVLISIINYVIIYKMLAGTKEILKSMGRDSLYEFGNKLSILMFLVAFVVIVNNIILLVRLQATVTLFRLVIYVIVCVVSFTFTLAYLIYLGLTCIEFNKDHND